jgi:hypothetical protein
LILLGVDDEDPPGADSDVIDIGSGARDTTVMENVNATPSKPVEALA